VSLLGCCSRSPAKLLVTEAGMSEVCISGKCSPTSKNTDAVSGPLDISKVYSVIYFVFGNSLGSVDILQ
jgi:hypothetical protein